METYSQIYNYCTATNEQQANGSSRAGSRSGRGSKGQGLSRLINLFYRIKIGQRRILIKPVRIPTHRPVSLVPVFIKD